MRIVSFGLKWVLGNRYWVSVTRPDFRLQDLLGYMEPIILPQRMTCFVAF